MKIEERINGFLSGRSPDERDNRNLRHLNLSEPFEVSGEPRDGNIEDLEVSDDVTVHHLEGDLIMGFPVSINGTECLIQGNVTFSYEYEEKDGVKDETSFNVNWDMVEDTFQIVSDEGDQMVILVDYEDVTRNCIREYLFDVKSDKNFENRMIEVILKYIESKES